MKKLMWLKLLVDEKIMAQTTLASLIDETEQLTAIFATILKSSRGG